MPDDDEAPTSAAWNAAVKAHEDSLVVGAKVRINLGECPLFDGWTEDGKRITINGKIAHRAFEHDQTGRIRTTGAGTLRYERRSGGILPLAMFATPDAGHRYLVWFDQPIADGADHGEFCAAELVVLDD